MEIQVSARPHMLLETVELLFAYINQIPPERLTEQREYCLPVEAVREIMEVACAGISRDDPAYRYYFAMHPLSDDTHSFTCIARSLVYMVMLQYPGSLAEACRMLKLYWHRELNGKETIITIGKFSPWLESQEASVTLLESISCLNMDENYIQKLRQQFLDYDSAIDRLHDLLAPVARKMEPFLEPWVEQATERARQWREALSAPGAEEWFLQLLFVQNKKQIDRIGIQLRYLDPCNAPGTIVDAESDLWEARERFVFAHAGLCIHPEREGDPELFDIWEFRAMRLLGSPVRLRMLHALWDNPMSSRELAKALNLNLGTLCRDINSLYESKLLIMESSNERRRYRTNRETMEYLAKHLARFGSLQLFEE